MIHDSISPATLSSKGRRRSPERRRCLSTLTLFSAQWGNGHAQCLAPRRRRRPLDRSAVVRRRGCRGAQGRDGATDGRRERARNTEGKDVRRVHRDRKRIGAGCANRRDDLERQRAHFGRDNRRGAGQHRCRLAAGFHRGKTSRVDCCSRGWVTNLLTSEPTFNLAIGAGPVSCAGSPLARRRLSHHDRFDSSRGLGRRADARWRSERRSDVDLSRRSRHRAKAGGRVRVRRYRRHARADSVARRWCQTLMTNLTPRHHGLARQRRSAAVEGSKRQAVGRPSRRDVHQSVHANAGEHESVGSAADARGRASNRGRHLHPGPWRRAARVPGAGGKDQLPSARRTSIRRIRRQRALSA